MNWIGIWPGTITCTFLCPHRKTILPLSLSKLFSSGRLQHQIHDIKTGSQAFPCFKKSTVAGDKVVTFTFKTKLSLQPLPRAGDKVLTNDAVTTTFVNPDIRVASCRVITDWINSSKPDFLIRPIPLTPLELSWKPCPGQRLQRATLLGASFGSVWQYRFAVHLPCMNPNCMVCCRCWLVTYFSLVGINVKRHLKDFYSQTK
jgi:hypothetical protein